MDLSINLCFSILLVFSIISKNSAQDVDQETLDYYGNKNVVRAGYNDRTGSWSESSTGNRPNELNRIMNQDRFSSSNYYNLRPPLPSQTYQVPDDAEDIPNSDYRQNLPFYDNNRQNYNMPSPYPYPLPYPYPYPYPLPNPPSSPQPQPTTPSTSTTTRAPSPIGYMLINTYDTPRGSYSRPIAFFRT